MFSCKCKYVYLIPSFFSTFITSIILIKSICHIFLYSTFGLLFFSLIGLIGKMFKHKDCVSSWKSEEILRKGTLEVLNDTTSQNPNIKGRHIYFSLNSKQSDHTFFAYLKQIMFSWHDFGFHEINLWPDFFLTAAVSVFY